MEDNAVRKILFICLIVIVWSNIGSAYFWNTDEDDDIKTIVKRQIPSVDTDSIIPAADKYTDKVCQEENGEPKPLFAFHDPDSCVWFYFCHHGQLFATKCAPKKAFHPETMDCFPAQDVTGCEYVAELDACDEPCLNGGTCIGANICDCPGNYYGLRCLYLGYSKSVDTVVDLDSNINGKMCTMFGAGNVVTFDGHIYDFPGTCQYEMVSSAGLPDFKVLVRKNPGCVYKGRYDYNHGNCIEMITVYIASSNIKVTISADSVTLDDQPMLLPYDGSGILLSRIYPFTILSIGEMTVKFDRDTSAVHVILDSVRYRNKTSGLCGNFNGNPDDDLVTKQGVVVPGYTTGHIIAKTWIERDVDEDCPDVMTVNEDFSTCRNSEEVAKVCNILWAFFDSCHDVLNPSKFFDLCKTELCRCDFMSERDCQCEVVTLYSRSCALAGGTPPEWRAEDQCLRSCPVSQRWTECGQESPQTCVVPQLLINQLCYDRCQCPMGRYENNGDCSVLSNCPCIYRGREYQPGAMTSTYNCNNCTCDAGRWLCESSLCPGTAHVFGFAHFKTFDDRFYTFDGHCQYVFAKDCSPEKSFTMYLEGTECGADPGVTCVKTFSIELTLFGQSQRITLKKDNAVSINNYVVDLPYQADGLSIYVDSSVYIHLRHASTGINVVWNGVDTIYVTLPQKYQGKLCGLAGNYNGNAADDFMSSQGMLESTPASFGNSWKLKDDCKDVDNDIVDPCTINSDKEKAAKESCGRLFSHFGDCHDLVNPQPYYKTCMYEYCECSLATNTFCMCEAMAVYAHKCNALGVTVDWRANDFCGVNCTGGQTYQACGSACGRTCRSISEPQECDQPCVEGCNCPTNYYLNPGGDCVLVEDCPCLFLDQWYKPGATIHTLGVLCQCISGHVQCEGYMSLPSLCLPGQVYHNCSHTSLQHQKVTGAECSKTCTNKDLPCPATLCQSGCTCPVGLVLHEKQCIEPSSCPCYHNNRGYEDGESIDVECNQCTCRSGGWQCTKKACGAQCSVYGESHYKSFDHKWFNFAGDCEYVLVTDECDRFIGTFKVFVKSNPCETLGYVCSRTVTIHLGSNQIVLEQGHPPEETSIDESSGVAIGYHISEHGYFIVVQSAIGLTVFWDHGTRVYVQLDVLHRGKVCGLCGNYDGDENNDFLMRSGEVVTVARVFGNNWRLKESCPQSNFTHTESLCDRFPVRKSWAVRQCGILESDLFKPCRSEIDHKPFLAHCLDDTCGCEAGGDCECFCTAVAAYVHECGQRGILVKWRSPTVCPTMCELYNKNDTCEWHYEVCGTSCPDTCCDRNNQHNCGLPCLEGCHPRCVAGTVFSPTTKSCISDSECGECPTTTTAVTTTTVTTPTTMVTTTQTTTNGTTPTTCPDVCTDAENETHAVGSIWHDTVCSQLECVFYEGECPRILNSVRTCLVSLECPEYKESRPITYENPSDDPDPCCEELECVCQSEERLYEICPVWNNSFKCNAWEQISVDGTYPDTSGCCPNFKCVCRSSAELESLCPPAPGKCKSPQEEVVKVTGGTSCCPSYDCVCKKCYRDGQMLSINEEMKVGDCTTLRCEVSDVMGACPTLEPYYDAAEHCYSIALACSEYEERYEVSYADPADDPNVCCPEFSCRCDETRLPKACPQWEDRTGCSKYQLAKAEVYTHDASGCCPVLTCECRPAEQLEDICETWVDFSCGEHETRNYLGMSNETDRCCPSYECVKPPCRNPLGKPFNGSIQYELAGECCTSTCVEEDGESRQETSCSMAACSYSCEDGFKVELQTTWDEDKPCCFAFKCVCDNRICMPARCPPTSKVVVESKADGVTTCCDTYKCENYRCEYNGQYYETGKTWRDLCKVFECVKNVTTGIYVSTDVGSVPCPDPAPCPSDLYEHVKDASLSHECCANYSCVCKYVEINGTLQTVGYEFDDPSDPECYRSCVVQRKPGQCPEIEDRIAKFECEAEVTCGECQERRLLRDDTCCGPIYECVDVTCASYSCPEGHELYMTSNGTCCNEYECKCMCKDVGSSSSKSFRCYQNYKLRGDCSYTLARDVGSDRFEISVEQGYCVDLYPMGTFTYNLQCYRKLTVRHKTNIFEMYPYNGKIMQNGIEITSRYYSSGAVRVYIHSVNTEAGTVYTYLGFYLVKERMNVFYRNPLASRNPSAVGRIDIYTTMSSPTTTGMCGNCDGDSGGGGVSCPVLSPLEYAQNDTCPPPCGYEGTCEEERCMYRSPCVVCRNCSYYGYEDPCLALTDPYFESCLGDEDVDTLVAKCQSEQCFVEADSDSSIAAQCHPCLSHFVQERVASCMNEKACTPGESVLGCATATANCSGIEVYSECADSCEIQRTCANLNGTMVADCIPAVVSTCACPEGYVYRSVDDRTCVKEECCACATPLPCEEGPNYVRVYDGVDSCGCKNYTDVCICSPWCRNPATGGVILPGEKADTENNCGWYVCPAHHPTSNPKCEKLPAVYREKPCYGERCSGEKVPRYIDNPHYCCPKTECVCPSFTMPSCTKDHEAVEYSEGECPKPSCVCDCPEIEASCAGKPGCRVQFLNSTGDCGCATEWKCVVDPKLCPLAPMCSECQDLVTTGLASATDGCDSECEIKQCQPKVCPVYPEMACADDEMEVTSYDDTVDPDHCCGAPSCICKPESVLEDICPEYGFRCGSDFSQKNRGKCCPDYECICNLEKCAGPPACGYKNLQTYPPTASEGSHADVCCATYNCTCEGVMCDEKPPKCPLYQKLSKVDNEENVCCDSYACVCDPTQYPKEASLAINAPDAEGICSLPGQVRVPVSDGTGCVQTCVCDETYATCAEYLALLDICKHPKELISVEAKENDLRYVCCPKSECVCAACGPDYVTKEMLESKLKPGEIVVPAEPASECCQTYQVICDPDAASSEYCSRFWPSCPYGSVAQRLAKDADCCPSYECVCDSSLCDEAPVCESPKIASRLEGNDTDCCATYECMCPTKTTDAPCLPPHVAYFTNGTCPETICRCPDDCPLEPTINCTSKPGCRAVAKSRDACECITESICVGNPAPCPIAPDCGHCSSATVVDTYVTIGNCSSTCSKYECRSSCPEVVIPECSEYQQLGSYFPDDDVHKCCPVPECICKDYAELGKVCETLGFKCAPGYTLSRDESSDVCCPSFSCVCNPEACPAPDDCGYMELVTTDPTGSMDGPHVEACCPSYNCTCEGVTCPAEPVCSTYQSLDVVENPDNVCCAKKTCVCDPTNYPEEYNSTRVKPLGDGGKCILPGQLPDPETDANGCLPKCICCPEALTAGSCPEYASLRLTCESPKVIVSRTAPADDLSYVCCPAYQCTCPDCGDDYVTKEALMEDLGPGEEVVMAADASPCCQEFVKVCKANASADPTCLAQILPCSTGYKQERLAEDNGCCPSYKCVCDISRCGDPPACAAPKVLGSSLDGECCHKYTCTCPPDENADLTCVAPKVLDSTATACPKKFCRCPDAEDCPSDPIIDCTSKPGCRPVVLKRDNCSCVIEAGCEGDPAVCPPPPKCSKCASPVEVGSELVVGDCNSTCKKYECRDLPCAAYDAPELPCPLYQQEVYVYEEDDADKCCPRSMCECKSEPTLADECRQWHDFKCETHETRTYVGYANGSSGCCPEYDCVKPPCIDPEGRPFTGTYTYEHDSSCCTWTCLEDGEKTTMTKECAMPRCSYTCHDPHHEVMIGFGWQKDKPCCRSYSCVCKTEYCFTPRCTPTSDLVVTAEADGVDTCCDTYTCVNARCMYRGKIYEAGTSWTDGCDSFSCVYNNETKIHSVVKNGHVPCPLETTCTDVRYARFENASDGDLCCKTFYCECVYAEVDGGLREVGYEYSDPSDPECYNITVVQRKPKQCPVTERVETFECVEQEECGDCQSKVVERDDPCCGTIYKCVDKVCPEVVCPTDQEKYLVRSDTCCNEYKCRCKCKDLGTSYFYPFSSECKEQLPLNGNCSYLLSQSIDGEGFQIWVDQGYCSELYPTASFTSNQMCYKKITVIYKTRVYQIWLASGQVTFNGVLLRTSYSYGVYLHRAMASREGVRYYTFIRLYIRAEGMSVYYSNPDIGKNPNAVGILGVQMASTPSGTTGVCGSCGTGGGECPTFTPTHYMQNDTCPPPCGYGSTCEEERCKTKSPCITCRNCSYFGYDNPCDVLDNEVFESCNGADRDRLYELCMNDQCFYVNDSSDAIAAQCSVCSSRFIQQHVASCKDKGICSDYQDGLGCDGGTATCPGIQIYESCVDSCDSAKTCEDITETSVVDCDGTHIGGCVCPLGYVYRSEMNRTCVKKECCACKPKEPCEEGGSMCRHSVGLDDCGCPIYADSCVCCRTCVNPANGLLMLPGTIVDSEDNCGEYFCPLHDPDATSPGCPAGEALYSEKPCYSAGCSGQKVPRYVNRPGLCCPVQECVCPNVTLPTCEKKYETVVYTSGECPKPMCVCECPEIEASCGDTPGCVVRLLNSSTDGCGCVTDWTCTADPRLCPKPPVCTACQVLVTTGVAPGTPECEVECPIKQCQPKPCDSHEAVTCSDFHDKLVSFDASDTERCCGYEKCVCKEDDFLMRNCDAWSFTCPSGYRQKSVVATGECCPSHRCECNTKACGSPDDCGYMQLVITKPTGSMDGPHDEACCPSYNCTCEGVTCPAEPVCSTYQSLDVVENPDNVCCAKKTCVCDPTKYPEEYNSTRVKPLGDGGKCILPGQLPDPETDSNGCLPKCICCPEALKAGSCPEYASLRLTCESPKVIVSRTAPADDLSYVCCPAYQCTCPDCGDSYLSEEALAKDLGPGEEVTLKGSASPCCQEYQKTCKANPSDDPDCASQVPVCLSGYILQRMAEDNGCCPAFDCVCDVSLCDGAPECEAPKVLGSSLVGGCCYSYTCTCPPDENADLTCDEPMVLDSTDTLCPKKFCRCPDDCPKDAVIDCSSKPGCRPVVLKRDNCSCVVEAGCEGDKAVCPPAPSCPPCTIAEVVGTAMMVGDCNSTCDKYRCARLPCTAYSSAAVPCTEYQQEVSLYGADDPDKCCPQSQCVCKPSADLKLDCPQWDFECEEDYTRVLTSTEEDCCPTYECACNSYACPSPPKCGVKTLVAYSPSTLATGKHSDVCCSQYNCTCEGVSCPAPLLCPESRKLSTSENATNPCCPAYECICDPDQYPTDLDLPENKPGADGACSLPGQIPVAQVDVSGCFFRCVCYSSSARLDYCTEYQAIVLNCKEPKQIYNVPGPYDDPLNYHCCPKVKCVCPACNESYQSQESLEATVVPGEIVVIVEPVTECCQQYQKICDPKQTTCPAKTTLPTKQCKWHKLIEVASESWPCCTDYEIVCDALRCPFTKCKSGYHRQVVDGEFWDDIMSCPSTETKCCEREICVCDVCVDKEKHYMPGEEWVVDRATCKTLTCSTERTEPNGCFVVTEKYPHCVYESTSGENRSLSVGASFSTEDPCLSRVCTLSTDTCTTALEDKLETCPAPPSCDKYHALVVEATPGVCCPEYACVCKECPYEGAPPTVDGDVQIMVNMSLDENPNQVCCPRSKAECADSTVLARLCPVWNFTCPIGQERIDVRLAEECCPSYVCKCKECPKVPAPVAVHPCHELTNLTLEENPLQDCCPGAKMKCMDGTECCGDEYVTYDQVKAGLKLGEEIIQVKGHSCCPIFTPSCIKDVANSSLCADYNAECDEGYKKLRSSVDVGCCGVYHCVCDKTLCAPPPVCEAPKMAKVTGASGSCCTVYECVCPPDESEDLVCEPPKVIANTTTACSTKYCRCPEASECPVDPDLDSCTSTMGCKAVAKERDECGCVVEIECQNDPALCQKKPLCEACYEAVSVGLVVAGHGDCAPSCQNYTCQHVPCPGSVMPSACELQTVSTKYEDCCPVYELSCKPSSCPSTTCPAGYKKVITPHYIDGEYGCKGEKKCCHREECVCEVCQYDRKNYKLGEEFLSDVDECVTYYCSSERTPTGCYVTKPRPKTCEHAERSYPLGSRIATANPCVTLLCKEHRKVDHCTHEFEKRVTTCPAPKECAQFYRQEPQHDALQCCPTYSCVCDDCPASYAGPDPARDLEWYETARNSTLSENPNQACCPTVQIVCDPEKKSLCPTTGLECKPGYVSVPSETDSHPCCPTYECVCRECRADYVAPQTADLGTCEIIVLKSVDENPNQECCPEKKVVCKAASSCCPVPECDAYEEAVSTGEMDGCCPKYECKCKSWFILSRDCPTASCSVGYEAVRTNPPTECCPVYSCVCKTCVDDGVAYPVGKNWTTSSDHCSIKTCTKTEDSCPWASTAPKYVCPKVDKSDCEKNGGSVVPDEKTEGCCDKCSTCIAEERPEMITVNHPDTNVPCYSSTKVNIPHCAGDCKTTTSHYMSSNSSETACSCCRMAEWEPRKLSLDCRDGSSYEHTYRHAVKCSCHEWKCPA